MRPPKKVVVGLPLAGGLAWLAVISLPLFSTRSSFMGKDAMYYAEFARACDSLLAQFPIGTNKLLEVSAADVVLPRIIRDWHPRRIQLLPQHVWIQVGETRVNGFGVTWRQDDVQTNT